MLPCKTNDSGVISNKNLCFIRNNYPNCSINLSKNQLRNEKKAIQRSGSGKRIYKKYKIFKVSLKIGI